MFDEYSRRARLAPVALLLIPFTPLITPVMAMLPGPTKVVSASWLLAAYLVEEIGRQRGRRMQETLWKSWGGPPATRMLRWRDQPESTVAHRHRVVHRVTDGNLHLPTAAEEASDPIRADEDYSIIVRHLIAITRGHQPLLLKENSSYGFRRNMLGLRPYGIASSLIAIASAWFALVLISKFGLAEMMIQIALAVATLLGWSILVTSAWVQDQAEAYAEELFKVAEGLAANKDQGAQNA
jgi:hypothetical protein